MTKPRWHSTKGVMLTAIALLVAWPALAVADSITPSSFSGSGPTGASYTVNKTVTVSAGPCLTCRADVLFLADTTGSMTGAIANVQASASSILGLVSGDIGWAVGEYRDIGDAFEYRLTQDVSTDTSAAGPVVTAINNWAASGGGDQPESALQALRLAAAGGAGERVSWRPGSARVIVWFGDNPSHDPAGSSATTEAAATAALTGAGVKVEAVSVNSGGSSAGLDTCVSGDCVNGQATRITGATGGTLFPGIDNAGVAAAIEAAITASFANYTSVCLATDGAEGTNVAVSFAPDCYVGSFDRSVERTFGFEVRMRDLVIGDHTFHINALVDGGIVATERDRIVSTPEPGSLLLLATGILGLATAGLRRRA